MPATLPAGSAPATGALPRILVVDDHEIVRLGVRQLLDGRALVAEAADLRAALDHLAREACDLVLLDLGLGDDFGLAAPPRLRDGRPKLKVVVLTSMPETLYAERCLQAGADGYVMKSALGQTLIEAVDTVLAGQIYVSPEQRNVLLRRVTGGGGADEGRAALTAREIEVLRLVAAGRSTREIAETLNRSVKTIETHKQSLKTKLGADTPAMLVRLALGWFGEGT